MKIKKISITAILSFSLMLTNLNYINAETNSDLDTHNKISQISVKSDTTSKYKNVELNKTYKHEIRYEPYDKSYNSSLYVGFELEQDGYITFKKSGLYTNEGNLNLDDIDTYKFNLAYRWNRDNAQYIWDIKNIREFESMGRGDVTYKIALKKGKYVIELFPRFEVDKDSYINYSINFEPKNIVDIEPNDRTGLTYNYASNIKFNKTYEGVFDVLDIDDNFLFNNTLKRDIDIKFRFKDFEKDEFEDTILYLNTKDKKEQYYIVEKKLADLEEDNDGYVHIKLDRFPKGEYYFGIDNMYVLKEPIEYTFEIMADELSYIDEIKGEDRYETAGLIADEQEYDTAILVNSTKSLADGLSASGLAGVVNAPILLTTQDSIPQETQKRLEGIKKIYLIGSENAISKKIEEDLKLKGIEVKRLGGEDRYKTSYEVAKEISNLKDIDKILLVNGYKGEADAMSVSPVASRDGVPIILTNGEDIPFKTNGIETYVIGSTSVMSKKIEDKTNATRLGGIDRFDTNKKVIKHFYGQPTEFYLSKSHQLVDALTGSPLAKKHPIVLVNNGSDKSILEGAKKVTALGGIDEVTIQQCIDVANGNL